MTDQSQRAAFQAATEANPVKVCWRRAGEGSNGESAGQFASRVVWDAQVKTTKAGDFVWVAMTADGVRSFRDDSIISVK